MIYSKCFEDRTFKRIVYDISKKGNPQGRSLSTRRNIWRNGYAKETVIGGRGNAL